MVAFIVPALMLVGLIIGAVVGTLIASPGTAEIAPPGKDPKVCAEFCSAWQRRRITLLNAIADVKAAWDW
jgi:hypothetical protein